MMSGSFLSQAFVYLAAAVVAVPLAKRLGLGSVLGYLLAGVVIGPAVLGLVGQHGQDVMHFAEFGVVMMLFVVGLELEPTLLWSLRKQVLGLGLLQVVVTSLVLCGVVVALGTGVKPALAIGMTLSMSSTAIVLQMLNEKRLMKTAAGQASFSVLLFQDLAVIPMLAVLPLLAVAPTVTGHGGEVSPLDQLPAWARTLVVLGSVVAIVVAGRTVVRPALRVIAGTRMLELFTAGALLLVVGIALLMEVVGLSPALGTFLAGVVLANSEYRHELISDIEPFKGLLLGLFFMAVGASINFGIVTSQPLTVAGLVLAVMVAKALVLWGLARVFGLPREGTALFALGLAQVGEFSFVLFSFCTQQGILDGATANLWVAVVALTMAATPPLMLFHDKVLLPRLAAAEKPERKADEIHEKNPVLIAGFDRFGTIVGRLLKANGLGATVLDHDSERVELLRRLGLRVYYGDPTRHELLHTAGAGEAKAIILAMEDPEQNIGLVHTVRKHFPHLTIFARAVDRADANRLLKLGVTRVYRETLDTSLRLGVDVMSMMGIRAHKAHRAAQIFLKHDERNLHELNALWDNRDHFINAARERIAELERVIQSDGNAHDLERDAGWDVEALRNEVLERFGELPPPAPAG